MGALKMGQAGAPLRSLTLYIEKKRKISKNFMKNNFIHSIFFLSRALTHRNFTFDSRFLSKLKHKVHHFSKSLCRIFCFWFRLIFPKFLFLFNKKYGLFDFKEATIKSSESVKKRKFGMEIFFSRILNKVIKNDIWLCKS